MFLREICNACEEDQDLPRQLRASKGQCSTNCSCSDILFFLFSWAFSENLTQCLSTQLREHKIILNLSWDFTSCLSHFTQQRPKMYHQDEFLSRACGNTWYSLCKSTQKAQCQGDKPLQDTKKYQINFVLKCIQQLSYSFQIS